MSLGGRLAIIGQITRDGRPLEKGGARIWLTELRDVGGHRIRLYQPGEVVPIRFWPDRRLPGTSKPTAISGSGGFYALTTQFDATSIPSQAKVTIMGRPTGDCQLTARLSLVALPREIDAAFRAMRADAKMRKSLKTRLEWVLKAARPSPEQLRWGGLFSVDVGAPPRVTLCVPGCRTLATGGGARCGRTSAGLGEFSARLGDCRGWESDRASFSKVIAEHYVRTEFGRRLRGNPTGCGSRVCNVDFPDGMSVAVSFARVPGYVIARALGRGMPRREYSYSCSPSGRVTLRPRQPSSGHSRRVWSGRRGSGRQGPGGRGSTGRSKQL